MTDTLIEQATKMGLEGPSILEYVEKQQAIERDERARERDAQRKHELELEALKLKQAEIKAVQKQNAEEVKAKTPRLPSFTEGEGIDEYLLRFERFARANHWAENTWASLLSALLTGKALAVYSRLSDDDAKDYKKVKDAILKRYELTEDGFKKKFRSEVPQEGEGPDQYIVRLSSYLNRWIELSDTPKTYEGLRDLIIQEQFLDLCPVDLSVHLRERKPKSLEELGKMSERYLIAHGRGLFEGARPRNPPRTDQVLSGTANVRVVTTSATSRRRCDRCIQNEAEWCGHCFRCGGSNHIARRCWKQGNAARTPPRDEGSS
ncbi:uncharacterized protein LOC144874156 [Branchiostoma floridae x Branchiostoma japonicum]